MKHSAETKRRALALLADPRRPLADVMAATGVDRRTLYNWRRAAGLPPRSRSHGSIYTEATRRLAVRLYRKGETMARISARTGACPHAIRQWVRAAGEPIRRTHTRARIDTEQAVALAHQHGVAEAARLLGCAKSTIHYHRNRALVLAVRAKMRRGRG